MDATIPNKWQFCELREVCKLPQKQVRPEEFSHYSNYVGLEDIESNTGKILRYENVQRAGLRSSKFLFDQSSVLYGKLRPYLNKVGMPDTAGICSTDILPLKPIPGRILREYLFFYLRSQRFVKTANAKSAGANLPRISPEVLLSIRIPLPSIEVQQIISQTLLRTDSLSEKRGKANELTNKIIPSVFLKMFGDPITNPKAWPSRKLGELAELRGGIQLSKERKPRKNPRPYLTIRNVYAGRLELYDIRYMEVGDDELEKWILKSGDLLVLEGGDRDDVGRTAIFHAELKNCVHQNHVFRVRVDRKYLLPEFVMHYLNSTQVKSRFFLMAKATTGINSINMTQLKSLEILCPPIELQEDFVRATDRAKEVETRQNLSAQEINQLFQSLMQKAFNGELMT